MIATSCESWGIIPARGGSKSIPLKNIVLIAGKPLIEYVIQAGKACSTLSRIICSTDHKAIADICERHGVQVHWRPPELGGDEVNVLDVLLQLLKDYEFKDGAAPARFALLQPTSPFTLPEHIDATIAALKGKPEAGSSQTIAPMPHNHHAFNQREVVDGAIQFRFQRERELAYNKQLKPKLYSFGNVVSTDTKALFEQRMIFATPSVPVVIPRSYAHDMDGPEDVAFTELAIEHKLVELPFLES